MLDFAIVGAQKSGTTTLRAALAAHPEVYLPNDEDAIFESPAWNVELADSHFGPIRRAAKGRCLGIKRPELLPDREAMARLTAYAPGVRLVAIVRDPVERAVSAYAHYASYGTAPNIDISRGLQMLLDGQLQSDYPRSWEILDFGFVGRQLHSLSGMIDPDQMMVLRLAELKDDPLSTSEVLRGFLGLGAPLDLQSIGRKNVGVYSAGRKRLISSGQRLGSNSASGRLFTSAMRSMDARLIQRLTRPKQLPRVEWECLARLRELYADDQRLLEASFPPVLR